MVTSPFKYAIKEGRETFPLSVFPKLCSNVAGIFILVFVILVVRNAHAGTQPLHVQQTPVLNFTQYDSLRKDSLLNVQLADTLYSKEEFQKEKLIAAILAFPIPFGFTGLHRIYLGSDPWIPVVYLITGGGGFGLIPLIDFIFIVTADEEQFRKYENNPKFFMWVE